MPFQRLPVVQHQQRHNLASQRSHFCAPYIAPLLVAADYGEMATTVSFFFEAAQGNRQLHLRCMFGTAITSPVTT
jgi:hypothetical protein